MKYECFNLKYSPWMLPCPLKNSSNASSLDLCCLCFYLFLSPFLKRNICVSRVLCVAAAEDVSRFCVALAVSCRTHTSVTRTHVERNSSGGRAVMSVKMERRRRLLSLQLHSCPMKNMRRCHRPRFTHVDRKFPLHMCRFS